MGPSFPVRWAVTAISGRSRSGRRHRGLGRERTFRAPARFSRQRSWQTEKSHEFAAAGKTASLWLLPPAVLDAAFAWLCHRRRDGPADADIWFFRRDWVDEKERIKEALLAERLLERVTRADGSGGGLWSARDAQVQKALTLVSGRVLPVSPRCTQVKGNGGAKAAVRRVAAALAANRFVLRTDVKSYYPSIDAMLLMERLARQIRERDILTLLGQYLRRTAEHGAGSGMTSAGYRSAGR